MIIKPLLQVSLIFAVVFVSGCAAMQTAIEHRHLETNTRLSKTIFLDPVEPSKKTIYLSVKNTSDEELDITCPLTECLVAQGYRVVKDSTKAHYLLQANILKVGKMSQAASQAALGGGYGSALVGLGTGVSVGALTGNGNAMISGGLIGGAVSFAADSLVKSVNYTMITDVQISERTSGKVTEQFNAKLQNGTASNTTQTYSQETQYRRYRTRIVSNADKVNLKFTDARPLLERGLVKTISGIF